MTNRVTRRGLLAGGAGAAAIAAVAAFELVDRGVLPGHSVLDAIDGSCAVPSLEERFRQPGPTLTGQFFSRARRRTVSYTLGLPPGHVPGDPLPLVISLYGDGGSYRSTIGGLSPAQAIAGGTGSHFLPPMAIVEPDGGPDLYWNPHPGDDPLAMVTDELIPLMRRHRIGTGVAAIGAVGISMGGYGALLLGERRPDLIRAVAAISPAVWTTYSESQAVNRAAFSSASDFARDDVISHAARLSGTPVRIASGTSDPFHPGVVALAARLPRGAMVSFPPGCHDGRFFADQQLPSLAFLGAHLRAV